MSALPAPMKPSDRAELLGLAAIWGFSFIFLRLGGSEFGAVPIAFLRVAGASLILLPWLIVRAELGVWRRHAGAIFVVGLSNSAVPFAFYGFAAPHLSAGQLAVFNASTPLFGALIAWLWLKEALTAMRSLGLALGFAGVLWLAWDKVSTPGEHPDPLASWAVLACLGSTLLYGWTASFTKRHLAGVSPLAVAAASQVSAALALAGPAWWLWPSATPSAPAWACAAGLAILCTALAYLLFFRLIAHVGPTQAISVTYLIPVFAVLWGVLFLHEGVTLTMALGCAIIVLGTALATGMLGAARQRRSN